MSSRIGLNIHANAGDFNAGQCLDYLLRLKPRAVVVLNNTPFAQQVRAALPECLVIWRHWPDDDLVNKMSPQAWVNFVKGEIGSDLWAYAGNEMGFTAQTIAWTVQVMKLAKAAGLKLVVGNYSSGTPQSGDWAQAREMLELLDTNRSTMILGLHEYFCGVVTSGFYGGYPNHAGVPFGQTGGLDLVPVANWPKDASGITLWHLGRFNFLVKYCLTVGLKPPRIILTEYGADDVSDVKPWAETLTKTAPYLNIRGWKTCQAQWKQWWLSWSPERAYFEQLKYADQTIYQPSPVEAQCIYSWGHSSADWEQFDISGAGDLQGYLVEYAMQAVLSVPKPGKYEAQISVGYCNLRAAPLLTGEDVGDLHNGDVVTVLADTPKLADDLTWIRIQSGDRMAWVALLEKLTFKAATDTIPIPQPDQFIIKWTANDWQSMIHYYTLQAQYNKAQADYHRSQADLFTKMADDAQGISDLFVKIGQQAAT